MKENQKVNEIVDAFKERGVITAREIREMKDCGDLTDDELHRFINAANSSGIKIDKTDYSDILGEDADSSAEESDSGENDVDTQYYSQYEEKIRQYKLLTADEEKL